MSTYEVSGHSEDDRIGGHSSGGCKWFETLEEAEAHAAKNSKRKIPRSAPARFYAYFVTEYPEGTRAEDGTFVSGGHFQRAEYRRGVKVAQAGDKLKNGAVVIDCANEVVIAAVRPGDRCPEFATWAIHYETGETYWGHYFGNIVDATKDFAKRAGLK